MNVKKAMALSGKPVEKTEEREYDALEGYGIFYAVSSLLEAILNAKEIGQSTLAGILHTVSGGDIGDKDLFTADRLLSYLKVPATMQEDLFSDDEHEAHEELELLQEIILDRMGEMSLPDFVAYALHNEDVPDMDGIVFDDASDFDMDWGFFTKKAECNKDKKSKHSCFTGMNKGVRGFWRYAKDFTNKKTGGVSASNHVSKGKNKKFKPSNKRIWSSQSRKWMKKAMKFHGREGKQDTQSKKASAIGA